MGEDWVFHLAELFMLGFIARSVYVIQSKIGD
jgi:hypothetical protein